MPRQRYEAELSDKVDFVLSSLEEVQHELQEIRVWALALVVKTEQPSD